MFVAEFLALGRCGCDKVRAKEGLSGPAKLSTQGQFTSAFKPSGPVAVRIMTRWGSFMLRGAGGWLSASKTSLNPGLEAIHSLKRAPSSAFPNKEDSGSLQNGVEGGANARVVA